MNLTLKSFKTLAVLLLAYSALAQEPSNIQVELGTVFKNESREIPVDIIGSDEKGYYILYSEGRFGQGDDMKIRRFNLDLTPSSQEINLKNSVLEGQFNSLGVTKLKDKIIHVFYILNTSGKHYYRQTVDLDNFTLGNTESITTIENDTKKASNSTSRFMISEDEKIITMLYTVPNKNKEHTKIRIQTYDLDFNLQKENEYEFPYNNNQFSIYSIVNTKDNGMVFLCKKYNSSKILKEENNKGYEFQVYKIENESLKKITSIIPKDVHLRYLISRFDNNTMIVTGLFSSKNIYAMKGVYNAKISLENGEIIHEVYNEFDSSYITQLMEDGKKKDRTIRKIKEGKFEDPNYVLDSTILLPNGELLVVAEQKHSVTINYATTFYHQNIAIMKLGSNGKLIWANKIGKNNEKGNVPIYNSFLTVLRDTELFLLYNCNSDNLNHVKGPIAKSFGVYNRVFMSAAIDFDGDFNRKVLISREASDDITIRPLLYNWVDKNTLLLFGQDIDNLKNQRFVKVKF